MSILARRCLCLLCRRASSFRPIVVYIVVDIVIVGLDVDVVGGFNASSKPFVLPPHLLPPLCCCRRHCCHCGHHHCCIIFVYVVIDVVVVVVVLVVVVVVFVVVFVIVVCLRCRCCSVIMRATQ